MRRFSLFFLVFGLAFLVAQLLVLPFRLAARALQGRAH